MRLLLLTFYTILFSCSPKQKINKQSYKIDSELQNDTNLSFGSQNPQTFDSEILETFVDSLNIGVKGKCKIELIRHRIYNDMFVIVKFYTKGRIPAKHSDVWMNTNLYVYQINTFGELFPSITDFNNDNFNDITFISGEAARGANEIRRLLIYDDDKSELISIVNSEDYPNMLYNNELDCIDAFLVYGGFSTVFLKIHGDMLKEFASVDIFDGLKVTIYDKNGIGEVIYNDTTFGNSDIRFKNFRPLKEYGSD